MKCPVCFASQEIYEGEITHVCPYCDAILVLEGGSLRRIDRFPWWIKRNMEVGEREGIIITGKYRFIFRYDGRWILNDEYFLLENRAERGRMDEDVVEIYGKLPILAFPGIRIGVEFDRGITIRHPAGSAIFERIEE